MSKIPVFDVVGESYAFSFRHYLKLFAVTWLPLLIATVASIYIFRNFFPDLIEIMKQQMAAPAGTRPADPFAGTGIMARIWLLDLAMLFLFVMMAVGITKEVLGVREAPRFVYFRFGADELRLLAGFAIVFLILIVAMVVAGVIAAVVGVAAMHGAAPQNPSPASGLVALIVLALYAIAFYFLARLSFFLPPVVVAEKRIGLGRAWELSGGNFWRIVAIALLIGIPVVIAECIVMGIMMVPAIVSAVQPVQGDPQAVAVAVLGAYVAMMPYMLAVFFFIAPIIYGLLLAPASFAYRALNPAAPSA
jgi:hypothetical protein